jgi:hypothetical protein
MSGKMIAKHINFGLFLLGTIAMAITFLLIGMIVGLIIGGFLSWILNININMFFFIIPFPVIGLIFFIILFRPIVIETHWDTYR